MAMIGSDAILLDSSSMLFCGVALVAPPIVLGIFLGKTVHIIVTICLGKDAGGSYGKLFAIALHYCGEGQLIVCFDSIDIHNDSHGHN